MSKAVYTVYFRGTLTTESPYANCPPGHRKPREPNKDRQLLPRIQVNFGGAFEEVPFIQPSTLKGKLRRAAAHVIADRFADAEEQVTFLDWLLWSLGGVKGTDAEDLPPRERQAIIASSALLSTFGAGESPAKTMVGAAFHVGPAIPEIKVDPVVFDSARAHENSNPALLDILSPEGVDQVTNYAAANRDRSQLSTKIKALEREVAKARKADAENKPFEGDLAEMEARLADLQRLLAEAVAAQKALGTAELSIGRPLPGYEALPAGLEMPHAMQLTGQPKAHVGFVLEALDEFAIDPIIGAHVSHGCGRISARYDVSIREGRSRQVQSVGRISYGGFDGLRVEGEWLEGCRKAWGELDFKPAAYRAAA